MSRMPLLSYIVLSYNYERYIAQTLKSILAQTVQDFEIVVVDDASKDRSVEVVTSFADPRIRLFQNPTNIGGAASYNRAIEAARGEWLVNLDADDWIAPKKAEIQLDAAKSDPQLDIIGSHVAVFDENDSPHSYAETIKSTFSGIHNFNTVDTWIGANHLCRSSTMVRAAAHRHIGLDDPDMVRAPDYELWTRALRFKRKIKVLSQELTFIRMHSRGVTHADPVGTFLEISYAMLQNLVPVCQERALHSSFSRILTWLGQQAALSSLLPIEGYRLLAMFMQPIQVSNFSDFKTSLRDQTRHPQLADIGRRTLSLLTPGAAPYQELSKLRQDIGLYVEARDLLQRDLALLQRDLALYVEARDYWHSESDRWEKECLALRESRQENNATPVEHATDKGLLARVLRRVRP